MVGMIFRGGILRVRGGSSLVAVLGPDGYKHSPRTRR